MNQPDRTRALIVVFDALRPEFVTPELMPNLHGFAARGVQYRNSRSTFPSETRVNQSAVTTGCYPRRHGVVANNFVVAGEDGPMVLTTGDDVAFEKALDAMAGPLLGVPTLGQRLAAAGMSYATVSAGTSGGGRLINIAARETGSFRFTMRRPEASLPAGIEKRLFDTVGPLPDYARPAIDWVRYATDCYLDFVEAEVRPDVMLLWLCEPDETFHYKGIGSPESLETIANADAQFGRILAHHGESIAAGHMQVVAMSDHGQISLDGEAIDLRAKFADGGFDPDVLDIVVANAGGVWLRGGDTARVADIAQWLQGQDWCGPVFTHDGAAGTLRLAELFVDHPRAPDIFLALASTDDENAWGRKGRSLHASRYPAGGGCHGGLSAHEMHNVLALSGSRFRQGLAPDVPAGNVDILPTLLHVLGPGAPEGIDGRVLREALRETPDGLIPGVSEKTVSSSNRSGKVTHLSVSDVDGTPYINRAWAE